MSYTRNDLIPIFLKFISQIKVYHWQTTNYARHIASNDLHTNLSVLVDDFIETYQGKNYRERLILKDANLKLLNLNDEEMVDYLQEFKDFIMNSLPELLPEGMKNPDLVNIRDEMLAIVNQTLYLFSLN